MASSWNFNLPTFFSALPSALVASFALLALLAAGCNSKPTDKPAAPAETVPATGTAVEGDAAASDPTTSAKVVPIKVNTMTCVAGCFNGIQMVLKKRPGIEDVKLAPQKNDEGDVDNSVILVSYQGELDRAEVEKTIVGAGFDSIEFLEGDAAKEAMQVE